MAAPSIRELPQADLAAFLRTIQTHTDADTPRLIFADWLDERGFTEWAGYIRRSVILANSPRYDDAYLDASAEHYRTAPTLRPRKIGFITPPMWVRYERGLPTEVYARLSTFRRHAQEIAESPLPLSRLNLNPRDASLATVYDHEVFSRFRDLTFRNGCRDLALHIRNLRHLQNIESLTIDMRLNSEEWASIFPHPAFEHLRRLDMRAAMNNGEPLSGYLDRISTRELTDLSMSCIFADRVSGSFANHPSMQKLESLNLSFWGGSDSGDIFAPLRDGAIPNLKRMTISGTFDDNDHRAIFHSERLHDWDFIDYSTHNVVAHLWRDVPDVPYHSGLRFVHRPRNRDDIRAFVNSPLMRRISDLAICLWEEPSRMIREFGVSPQTAGLRCLSIHVQKPQRPSRKRLLAEHFRPFARSPQLSNLVRLELSGIEVEWAALSELIDATFANSLQHLSLWMLGEPSRDDIVRLARPEIFPNLRRLRMFLTNGARDIATPMLRARFGPAFSSG